MAEVHHRRLYHRQAPPFAVRLLGLLHSARLDQRRAPRLAGRHAAAEVAIDLHLEMALQFLAQLPIPALPVEQPGQPPQHCPHRSHGTSPEGRRNRSMIAAV